MLKLTRKGQSTAEYAIVIGLVIAAAVAMQIYVKRGIQAKMKDAVDNPITAEGGSDYGVNTYSKFEPQDTITLGEGMKTTMDSTEKVKTDKGGAVRRDIVGDEVSNRTGIQQTLASPNQ